MVRIMLVDDHLLFRQVVREIIARGPEWERVTEADDGQNSMQMVNSTAAKSVAQSVRPQRKKSKRHLPLTEREQQVLSLIRQGQRNREIANELRIAESTVHKHVQNIFEKLNARNRAEALFLVKM